MFGLRTKDVRVESAEHRVALALGVLQEACGDYSPEVLCGRQAGSAARDLAESVGLLRGPACEGRVASLVPDGHASCTDTLVAEVAAFVIRTLRTTSQLQPDGQWGTEPFILSLRLCGILLDCVVCHGLRAANGTTSGTSPELLARPAWIHNAWDASANVLRPHHRQLVRPAFSSLAAEVLRGLCDAASSRTLDNERLLRTVGMASDVVSVSSGDGAVAEAAADAVVAAVASTVGVRLESFEIMLGALLRPRGSGPHAHMVAGLVLRALEATCVPPPVPSSPRYWMPQCHAEARQCARLAAVGLQRAANDMAQRQRFEAIVEEVAAASLQPGWPSAPLLLRAMVGSLIAVLRCRGSGDGKILAVRALSQATVQLGRAPAVSAEVLCSSCTASSTSCPRCSDASCDQRRHTCGRDAEPAESCLPMQPEECDLCVLKLAAQNMPGCGASCSAGAAPRDRWVQRYLCLCSDLENLCGGGSAQAALASWCRPRADTAQVCHFRLCDWSAGVWGEGEAMEAEQHTVTSLWDWLRSRQHVQLNLQRHGQVARIQRHLLAELVADAHSMLQKVLRLVALQLASSRPLLRAEVLRGLKTTVEGSEEARATVRKAFPRSVFLSILQRDPSPKARCAVLRLLGQIFMAPAAETEVWALEAVRGAGGDESVAVRTLACRLMGTFLRCGPDETLASGVCGDLLMLLGGGHAAQSLGLSLPSRTGAFESMARYLFGPSGIRAPALLDLLAAAQRLGVKDFLKNLLRAHLSKPSSSDTYRETLRLLGSELLDAFVADPKPSRMSGLRALSSAAPWALVSHARTIAVYLAVSCPPGADEEVLALAACDILADILRVLGPGATHALSSNSWAYVDGLVASGSSRLARPAMRCLCAVAVAEDSARPILAHLWRAVQTLWSDGTQGLVRAAWISSTACELCDLDRLVTPGDLGLASLAGAHAGVVSMIATRLFSRFDELHSSQPALMPALVLAVGFAMRRQTQLATSTLAKKCFAHALAARPGEELLAERAVEALTHVLERVVVSEQLHGTKCPAATDVVDHVVLHQPAILRLLCHGLHRYQVADVPLRCQALVAMRTFFRAGLAHPGSLARGLVPLLFAGRCQSRGAGSLLFSIARKHPEALVSVVSDGTREAFCAALWHAPSYVSLSAGASPVLKRMLVPMSKAFSVMNHSCRSRWLRALIAELLSLTHADFRSRFSELPTGQEGAGRLSPFSSGRRRLSGKVATHENACFLDLRRWFGPTDDVERPEAPTTSSLTPFSGKRIRFVSSALAAAAVSKVTAFQENKKGGGLAAQALPLLYGHFVTNIIVALPLSANERQLVSEECARFLELRAASVSSAQEHGARHSVESLLTVCAATALCRGVKYAIGKSSGLIALHEAVTSQIPCLAVAFRSGSEALAGWLDEALETDLPKVLCGRAPPSCGHSVRWGEKKRAVNQFVTPCKETSAKEEAPTPPKRRLSSDVTPPCDKRRRGVAADSSA